MVMVTGDQDLKTVLLLRLCAGFPVLALLFGSPDEILLHRDWGRTPSPLVRMATQILLLAASKTISAHSLPCPRSGWVLDDLVRLVVDIIPSDRVSNRSTNASDSLAPRRRQASFCCQCGHEDPPATFLAPHFLLSTLPPSDPARTGSQQHRESTIVVDQPDPAPWRPVALASKHLARPAAVFEFGGVRRATRSPRVAARIGRCPEEALRWGREKHVDSSLPATARSVVDTHRSGFCGSLATGPSEAAPDGSGTWSLFDGGAGGDLGSSTRARQLRTESPV